MLKLFFAAVYFVCFFKVWRAVFTYVPVNDVLALFSLLMALIASVGLAEFTVRKIRKE